jgi:dihydrofolate reductase
MKTSVYIATTLDGFIARENGALDWLPGSDGIVEPGLENEDYGYQAFMDSVDVLVMGRNTYELVISSGFWPYADKRVIVLSTTLKNLSPKLTNKVELKSCSANTLYTALEQSGAQHIYVDGGKTIQGFLNAGLIDEIIITQVPTLIGKGIPLFGPLDNDVKLQHLNTTSFKNGFVQSKYNAIN